MGATDGIRRRGFSPIEFLAIVAILGIIAFLLMPRIASESDEVKQQAHQRIRSMINEAVESFYINENHWPANDLSDIGADANYFPKGLPANPVDGSAYSLDPTTHRVR